MSKPAPPPPPPLDGYIIYDPVDPFENDAGPFHWRLLDDGGHHFVLRSEPRHANAYGVIHGGLLMTMADLIMAVTAKEEPDDAFVTVAFNCEFVAAGHVGDLIEARAELIRRTGSMAFVRGHIHVCETTLLICSAVMKRVGKRGALNNG
jgi:acyl-coenzyme A thioesterase 13